jgi:hypothetical protein
MNPSNTKSATNPLNHSVHRTFHLSYITTSFYLGMTQLMAGGGIALLGILLIPQLTGLFG